MNMNIMTLLYSFCICATFLIFSGCKESSNETDHTIEHVAHQRLKDLLTQIELEKLTKPQEGDYKQLVISISEKWRDSGRVDKKIYRLIYVCDADDKKSYLMGYMRGVGVVVAKVELNTEASASVSGGDTVIRIDYPRANQ